MSSPPCVLQFLDMITELRLPDGVEAAAVVLGELVCVAGVSKETHVRSSQTLPPLTSNTS